MLKVICYTVFSYPRYLPVSTARILSFILKEVDLIPDGSKVEVTKENRMKYLDALAQYKLHTRVSAEIEAFAKGMHVVLQSLLWRLVIGKLFRPLNS